MSDNDVNRLIAAEAAALISAAATAEVPTTVTISRGVLYDQDNAGGQGDQAPQSSGRISLTVRRRVYTDEDYNLALARNARAAGPPAAASIPIPTVSADNAGPRRRAENAGDGPTPPAYGPTPTLPPPLNHPAAVAPEELVYELFQSYRYM